MKKILIAENLHKSYSIKNKELTHVITGLGLTVYSGDFLAITGPSGIGKSTLLYLLSSLDKPDKGSVKMLMNNEMIDISKMNSDEVAHIRNVKMGYVFQFHYLLPEFTALENIMIPAMILGKNTAQMTEKAKELAEETGIFHRINHKPNELSGGEQQRVAIARALINNPEIVFADEPTGNLDKKNTQSVLELINKLQENYSLTFVVATHNAEVADVARRRMNMEDGCTLKEDNELIS